MTALNLGRNREVGGCLLDKFQVVVAVKWEEM